MKQEETERLKARHITSSRFLSDLEDRAKYIYLENIPTEVQKRLTEELEYIKKYDLERSLLAVESIMHQVGKYHNLATYVGTLSNSLVAYLLGLTELNPVDYSIEFTEPELPFDFKIILPNAMSCEWLINTLESECISIKPDDDNGYYLEFKKIPHLIHIVIAHVHYQDILSDVGAKTDINSEEILYTQKSLLDKHNLNIEDLLNRELPEKDELSDSLTAALFHLKLEFYRLYFPYEYYKSVLENSFCNSDDFESIITSIQNDTYDKNDYLMSTLKKMYEDCYSLSYEESDILEGSYDLFLHKDGEKIELSLIME